MLHEQSEKNSNESDWKLYTHYNHYVPNARTTYYFYVLSDNK